MPSVTSETLSGSSGSANTPTQHRVPHSFPRLAVRSHGCGLRPCLVPSCSAMAWYPPPPEPFSKLLVAQQCSLLNAPFVRSSSHFCLPRALPQFLHLQLASLSSSFHGGLIMSLILPHLDSLWSVCLPGVRLPGGKGPCT